MSNKNPLGLTDDQMKRCKEHSKSNDLVIKTKEVQLT